MQSYTLLFFVVGLMVLVAMIAPYFNWWMKSIIVLYYGSVSFLFISKHRALYEEYKGNTSVSAAYRQENSEWAWTASNLIFWPFSFLLIYLFYRLFHRVQTVTAKLFLVFGLVLAAALIFYLKFAFNFEYGYLP